MITSRCLKDFNISKSFRDTRKMDHNQQGQNCRHTAHPTTLYYTTDRSLFQLHIQSLLKPITLVADVAPPNTHTQDDDDEIITHHHHHNRFCTRHKRFITISINTLHFPFPTDQWLWVSIKRAKGGSPYGTRAAVSPSRGSTADAQSTDTPQ